MTNGTVDMDSVILIPDTKSESAMTLLLLSIHSLKGWIPQDSLVCWLLIPSNFVLSTILLSKISSNPKSSMLDLHLSDRVNENPS